MPQLCHFILFSCFLNSVLESSLTQSGRFLSPKEQRIVRKALFVTPYDRLQHINAGISLTKG